MARKGVFIDTSVFGALVDRSDQCHVKALQLWENLHERAASLITSNYILDEAFTLIRARCGVAIVVKFRDMLAQSSQILRLVRVTTTDEARAWEWFARDWAKLSFTDCVSFAVMERLELKEAASFDADFVKAGFKLVG